MENLGREFLTKEGEGNGMIRSDETEVKQKKDVRREDDGSMILMSTVQDKGCEREMGFNTEVEIQENEEGRVEGC